MIQVFNDSGNDQGICIYQVQIGKQHICRFEHNREEGLARCLQKAADAVELNEWVDFVLMSEIKGG